MHFSVQNINSAVESVEQKVENWKENDLISGITSGNGPLPDASDSNSDTSTKNCGPDGISAEREISMCKKEGHAYS